MIRKEKVLQCKQHNSEVVLINCGECNTIEERLLCQECFHQLEGVSSILKLKQATSIFQQKYDQVNQQLGPEIKSTQQLIQICLDQTQKIRDITKKITDRIEKELNAWRDWFIKETKLSTDNIYDDINYLLTKEKTPNFNYVDQLKKEIVYLKKQFYSILPPLIKQVKQEFITFQDILLDKEHKDKQKKREAKIKITQENMEQKLQMVVDQNQLKQIDQPQTKITQMEDKISYIDRIKIKYQLQIRLVVYNTSTQQMVPLKHRKCNGVAFLTNQLNIVCSSQKCLPFSLLQSDFGKNGENIEFQKYLEDELNYFSIVDIIQMSLQFSSLSEDKQLDFQLNISKTLSFQKLQNQYLKQG